MERGGGEDEEAIIVAISPPPQFQDTPAPPPPVFSDCLADFASRISFDILNEAMVIATGELLLLHPHGPHDEARQQPGGGPSSSSHVSPGSSEEDLSSSSNSNDSNPLSTTTSWEFISKASSWSDLRCLHFQPQSVNERMHTSPRHQPALINGGSRSNSKKSGGVSANHSNAPSTFKISPLAANNQQCSSNNGPTCSKTSEPMNILGRRSFVSVSQRISPMTSSSHSPTAHRFSYEGPPPCTTKDSSQAIASSSSTSISNEESSCYKNVPFQCDIYSMPVDSIVSTNDESSGRPVPAPRRSRVRDSRGMILHNHQGSNRKSSCDIQSGRDDSISQLSTTSQPFVRIQVPQVQNSHRNEKHSRDSDGVLCVQKDVEPFTVNDCSTSTNEQFDHERNNNNASCSSVNNADATCSSLAKKAARRSRSVEINGTSGTIAAAKESNTTTSQTTKNQSSAELSHESQEKPEKKWLGHSILNLFKRHKPRIRSDNIMTSCISISSDTERYTNGAQEQVLVNATRALPPTPSEVRVESISAASGAGRPDVTDDFDSPPSSFSPHEVSLGGIDFAASIEKVKDCGWYWGPLSSESAEDLLRGEPDGSFIVRDSSDAHYIFSLTFKLNGLVRHVRIEHDQGNFSFGPLTRFKAATIVDFVEKAVAHSRSGRYLFFLHRRPVLGPMRVQLLHPYSRFRHPRSLQHMCRFVILKSVRRDLIHTLPLPKPLQDYLNTPHYYFEQPEEKLKSIH